MVEKRRDTINARQIKRLPTEKNSLNLNFPFVLFLIINILHVISIHLSEPFKQLYLFPFPCLVMEYRFPVSVYFLQNPVLCMDFVFNYNKVSV